MPYEPVEPSVQSSQARIERAISWQDDVARSEAYDNQSNKRWHETIRMRAFLNAQNVDVAAEEALQAGDTDNQVSSASGAVLRSNPGVATAQSQLNTADISTLVVAAVAQALSPYLPALTSAAQTGNASASKS